MNALDVVVMLAAQLNCPVAPSILGSDAIPADGSAAVPTNTTPIVTGADLELRLVGIDGNDIAASIEDIVVGGSFGVSTTLRRVIPAGDLSPGEQITIIADGQARSTFTVGDARDDSAPDAPAAEVNDVLAGTSYGACPQESSLVVGVAASSEGGEDAALFIGVVDGEPAIGAGVRLDGASTSDELVLFAEGAVRVNVAAVDLAGNVSASVPVEAELPPVKCACASPSREPPLLVAGLALTLMGVSVAGSLRRRRGTRTS